MKEKCLLGARLSAAASLVRDGVTVADVGCDHAYVLIEMFRKKNLPFAIASDIHKGPLECARSNLQKYGFLQNTVLIQTDGFQGLECYHPEDVIIAGMGAEMIISILQKAPYLCSASVHLILQPMNYQERLRNYLCRNGFHIDRELLAQEDGKIYQILSAFYTGQPEELTPAEALLGKYNLQQQKNNKIFRALLKSKISMLKHIIEGKQKAGISCCEEQILLLELQQLAEETEPPHTSL